MTVKYFQHQRSGTLLASPGFHPERFPFSRRDLGEGRRCGRETWVVCLESHAGDAQLAARHRTRVHLLRRAR